MFFSLNPAKLLRWQGYFNEWEKQYLDDASRESWMIGGYVQRAIGASFSKSGKYPSEPVQYWQEAELSEKESGEKEEHHVFTDADNFFVFAQAMNKNIRGKIVKDVPSEEVKIADAGSTCETEEKNN